MLYGFLLSVYSGIFPMLLAGLLLVLLFNTFGPFGLFGSIPPGIECGFLWDFISISLDSLFSGHGDAPYTAGFIVSCSPCGHCSLLYVNLALNGYPVILCPGMPLPPCCCSCSCLSSSRKRIRGHAALWSISLNPFAFMKKNR